MSSRTTIAGRSVLVTGGTGTLGRLAVSRLRDAGCDVRVLTRRSPAPDDGIQYMTGDLTTGEGIEAAVDGVTAIMHCAGSATGDVVMTQNLVRAVSALGQTPHLVFISVVGADRVPTAGIDRYMFGYFRSKRAAERVVAGSGLPWTTLRATQFRDLILLVARQLARLPAVPVPKGFRFQLVEADEVAARMLELALGEPAGRMPDMGGPRVYDAADLFGSYLQAIQRRRPLIPIPLPLPTRAARAIRQGALLAPGQAVGRRTWEEFLADRVGELAATETVMACLALPRHRPGRRAVVSRVAAAGGSGHDAGDSSAKCVDRWHHDAHARHRGRHGRFRAARPGEARGTGARQCEGRAA